MVVSKMRLKLICVLCSLTLFACGSIADDKSSSNKVLDLLSRKILTATTNYGKRIDKCDQDIKRNETPKLSEAKLQTLVITREEAITALAYLQFDNYHRCTESEKKALGFLLETMEHLRQSLGEEAPEQSLQTEVIYPSQRELLLEVNYLNLPDSKREYIEGVVNGRVFDLIKALEVNQLLVE